MSSPVDAVIFDLGGVLADFGGVGPMRRLSGLATDEEIWERWLTCPWVRTFERGGCSAGEFAAGVVADWCLPIAPEEFLDDFRTWLSAPLPGAEELVRAVRARATVACLSNTNEVHWEDRGRRWELMDLFDHRFLSFELGRVKPDAEAYEYAIDAIAAPPQRVLFLDDNQLNVDGAAAVGLQVARVRGVDEARHALVLAGVL